MADCTRVVVHAVGAGGNASKYVAASDDDRRFHVQRHDRSNLVGDAVQYLGMDAVALITG